MQPSEIKLEQFSNCPGADRVRQYLYEHYLNSYFEVVDLKENFYQNNRDTFVLALLSGPTEAQVALALGTMAVELHADEYNWKAIEGKYIVRLWWD